jgi:HEAT repeat protein
LAQIDLGVDEYWVLTKKDGPCTLSGTMEIPAQPAEHPTLVWRGQLEFPPVALPLENPPLDPATAEETIRRLGSTMIDARNPGKHRAQAELSFIDDPRVIPWYLELLKFTNYEAKQTALDRLSQFNSDEALAGIMQALSTKASDITNCTTHELAQSSAEATRHTAAVSLARSRHPGAKAILLSLADDRSMPIRMTVLHELGRMKDEVSLELIRKMNQDDPDERIRTEAKRYLDLRTKTAEPADDSR